MKKLYMLLMALLVCVAANAAPDLYLRGAISGSSWPALEKYKFTQDGDIYTLNVDKLSGQFKIADKNWGADNYGGPTNPTRVNIDTEYTLVSNGQNLQANGSFSNITITFNRATKVMKITGQAAEATITYVLNGNFGDGWKERAMTKGEDNLWSVTVTPAASSCVFGVMEKADGLQSGYFKGGDVLSESNPQITLSADDGASDSQFNCIPGKAYTFIYNPENRQLKIEFEGGGSWTAPEKAYFSASLDGNWAFNTEMTAKGNGVFTYEEIMVNATSGYMTFTTGLMENWEVPDGVRYGSGANDVNVESGVALDCVAGSDKAFVLAKGKWNVELTFTQSATKVKFEQLEVVEPFVPENLYFNGNLEGE